VKTPVMTKSADMLKNRVILFFDEEEIPLIPFPILNYPNGLWNAFCISLYQTGNR
jgi:hypothetical protein